MDDPENNNVEVPATVELILSDEENLDLESVSEENLNEELESISSDDDICVEEDTNPKSYELISSCDENDVPKSYEEISSDEDDDAFPNIPSKIINEDLKFHKELEDISDNDMIEEIDAEDRSNSNTPDLSTDISLSDDDYPTHFDSKRRSKRFKKFEATKDAMGLPMLNVNTNPLELKGGKVDDLRIFLSKRSKKNIFQKMQEDKYCCSISTCSPKRDNIESKGVDKPITLLSVSEKLNLPTSPATENKAKSCKLPADNKWKSKEISETKLICTADKNYDLPIPANKLLELIKMNLLGIFGERKLGRTVQKHIEEAQGIEKVKNLVFIGDMFFENIIYEAFKILDIQAKFIFRPHLLVEEIEKLIGGIEVDEWSRTQVVCSVGFFDILNILQLKIPSEKSFMDTVNITFQKIKALQKDINILEKGIDLHFLEIPYVNIGKLLNNDNNLWSNNMMSFNKGILDSVFILNNKIICNWTITKNYIMKKLLPNLKNLFASEEEKSALRSNMLTLANWKSFDSALGHFSTCHEKLAWFIRQFKSQNLLLMESLLISNYEYDERFLKCGVAKKFTLALLTDTEVLIKEIITVLNEELKKYAPKTCLVVIQFHVKDFAALTMETTCQDYAPYLNRDLTPKNLNFVQLAISKMLNFEKSLSTKFKGLQIVFAAIPMIDLHLFQEALTRFHDLKKGLNATSNMKSNSALGFANHSDILKTTVDKINLWIKNDSLKKGLHFLKINEQISYAKYCLPYKKKFCLDSSPKYEETNVISHSQHTMKTQIQNVSHYPKYQSDTISHPQYQANQYESWTHERLRPDHCDKSMATQYSSAKGSRNLLRRDEFSVIGYDDHGRHEKTIIDLSHSRSPSPVTIKHKKRLHSPSFHDQRKRKFSSDYSGQIRSVSPIYNKIGGNFVTPVPRCISPDDSLYSNISRSSSSNKSYGKLARKSLSPSSSKKHFSSSKSFKRSNRSQSPTKDQKIFEKLKMCPMRKNSTNNSSYRSYKRYVSLDENFVGSDRNIISPNKSSQRQTKKLSKLLQSSKTSDNRLSNLSKRSSHSPKRRFSPVNRHEHSPRKFSPYRKLRRSSKGNGRSHSPAKNIISSVENQNEVQRSGYVESAGTYKERSVSPWEIPHYKYSSERLNRQGDSSINEEKTKSVNSFEHHNLEREAKFDPSFSNIIADFFKSGKMLPQIAVNAFARHIFDSDECSATTKKSSLNFQELRHFSDLPNSHSPLSSKSRKESLKENSVLSILWEKHEEECRKFRNDPESYPTYNEEKITFMEKKAKQIVLEEIYPSASEITSEWNQYWREKIEDLFRKNWTKKLIEHLSNITNPKIVENKEMFANCKSTEIATSKEKGLTDYKFNNIVSTGFNERDDSFERKQVSPFKDKNIEMPSLFNEHIDIISSLSTLVELSNNIGMLGVHLNMLYGRALELNGKGIDPINIINDNSLNCIRAVKDKLLECVKEKLTFDQHKLIQKGLHISTLLMSLRPNSTKGYDIHSNIPSEFWKSFDYKFISKETLGFSWTKTFDYVKNLLSSKGFENIEKKDISKIVELIAFEQKKLNNKDNVQQIEDKMFSQNSSYIEPICDSVFSSFQGDAFSRRQYPDQQTSDQYHPGGITSSITAFDSQLRNSQSYFTPSTTFANKPFTGTPTSHKQEQYLCYNSHWTENSSNSNLASHSWTNDNYTPSFSNSPALGHMTPNIGRPSPNFPFLEDDPREKNVSTLTDVFRYP